MNFKRYKRIVIFGGICGCIFAHPSPVTPINDTTSEVNGLDTAVAFNKSYANNVYFKNTSLAIIDVQLLHKKIKSQGTIAPNAATQNASLVFKASEDGMFHKHPG
ncbi:MAG: hypothetical protein H7334_11965 [Ferruginibacter sp.]|nr:hypothetical protein [Ferruginibacter sp.]